MDAPRHDRPRPHPATAGATIVRAAGVPVIETIEAAEAGARRWLAGAFPPQSPRSNGFVTPDECAEVMGYVDPRAAADSPARRIAVERVISLARARVLESVDDGFGRWLVRPAVVSVSGKVSRELLP